MAVNIRDEVLLEKGIELQCVCVRARVGVCVYLRGQPLLFHLRLKIKVNQKLK